MHNADRVHYEEHMDRALAALASNKEEECLQEVFKATDVLLYRLKLPFSSQEYRNAMAVRNAAFTVSRYNAFIEAEAKANSLN